MEFTGHLEGAAARKYAGFSYCVPVLVAMTVRQLDEFPRSVNPPSDHNLQTKDVADFVVKIGATGPDGMSQVQVWLRSNKYTAAMHDLLVCEFRVAHALTLRHEYVDEALRRAFR